LALLFLFFLQPSLAQKISLNRDGLLLYLNSDSSLYLKFNFVTQLWVRYTENNPGSTIQNVPKDNVFDIGLRRTRFMVSGQFSPRTFFYVQFGQNSLSYLSPRKTGAFFHDIMAEYHILRRELHLGGGLMGWNGPTRYSNSAIGAILGLETPAAEEVTFDVNDQVLRKLGMYAKGTLGKIEYRASVAKPFIVQTANPPPEPISKNSTYSTNPPNLELQSYVRYQFFQNESMIEPFPVGTYLGSKKVLNVGIGADYQSKAMSHTSGTDTVLTNMLLLAIDGFADLPLDPEDGNAITLYLSLCKYDYGKGFIRMGGPMNPATGVIPGQASFNGPGNAYPQLGNGNVIYFQGGYLLKKDLLGKLGTIQPYFDFTHGNYDRVAEPVNIWDLGFNWLINGRRVKLTCNYQNRPIYFESLGTKPSKQSNKSMWVMQFQLAI